MASGIKKPKTYDAFMARGDCCDEITFVFNDDQKLYVSQNLLMLASPVFKAMFDSKSSFKESTKRTVKIVDVKFEDFREFLYCIHPDIQKPVTYDNVLNIASIAEKYQSQLIIARCKNSMEMYLNTLPSKYGWNAVDRYKAAYIGLQLLHKALELNYEQIVEKSITMISKFGSKYFTGLEFSNHPCNKKNEDEKKAKELCSQAFSKLQPNIRFQLLIARHNNSDDMEMK